MRLRCESGDVDSREGRSGFFFVISSCRGMTFAVHRMAFATAKDPQPTRLRRWSSIGIRNRTSSLESNMVCRSLISYTN